MNSELLREREAFKKRAMATASVTAPSKKAKESATAPPPEVSRKSKSGDQVNLRQDQPPLDCISPVRDMYVWK
jgi:hypothetical protein